MVRGLSPDEAQQTAKTLYASGVPADKIGRMLVARPPTVKLWLGIDSDPGEP